MTALPDLSATMRALAFLSRVPIPDRFFDGASHQRTAEDAVAFPFAGGLIALPCAAILVLASLAGAPALLAATLATCAAVAVTGALHEDGLADTADGFGGGRDAAHRLEIMTDSRVGAYGVIALVAVLMVRVIALAAIIEASGWLGAAIALVGVNAASRAILVWHWSVLTPARETGVAAAAGQPGHGSTRIALAIGVGALLAAALPLVGIWPTTLATLIAAGATLGFARLSRRAIGGHTGDTIGASEQIAHAALLCGLAMQP